MFGLSTREILSKAILNVSKDRVVIYKQGIKVNIDVLNGAVEAQIEEIIMPIIKEYLDEVVNIVFSSFGIDCPTINTRIKMALVSPALCGYEDIEISNGIMAGSVYAICYYAIKNKVAAPRDCSRLNHLQYEIMHAALAELDNEI